MTIHSLPPEVYMKIAAGEVVANPACVLKELVENALDAQASALTVRFQNGGIDAISVKDNGIGMSETDITQAILPHATSKLTRWEDLSALDTFGFRGEALAAITAVSETILVSRYIGEETGIRLYVRGGSVLENKRVNAGVGTDIEVRNLFFNVPARRKFLKSPVSEERKLVELLENFLISFPHIQFRIDKDGEVLYEVPKQTLLDRLPTLFQGIGKEEWRLLEENFQGLIASAYIADHKYFRRNRSAIHTFVNGRLVKNPVLYAAIDGAMEPVFAKKYHPFLVLFLTLPKDFVDINVHPQKLEVQFARSEWVFHLVQKLLQKRVQETVPEITIAETSPIATQKSEPPRWELPTTFRAPSYSTNTPEKLYGKPDPYLIHQENISEPFQSPAETEQVRVLGIVGRRYILGEDPEGVFFIDFHAAHERLLFDEISANNGQIASQEVLEPIPIPLNPMQTNLIEEHRNALERFGFRFRKQDQRYQLEGIPQRIGWQDAELTLLEILEELRLTSLEPMPEAFRRIFASIACKQAFRTGDAFTVAQAADLIREMARKQITTCPHGRPVRFRLSLKELDRYFER
ncbi:MAG TPA: DNA mismatch repair endonuclease MutL [Thermotogota bacterium]|nr:DNA mismatch repair endonuclease MutL [Thermotogota bacterium]HNT95379.1 DNA mismatch repair endonuclease MutL [Thermotogota bacterium]HOZ11970.1 DNA mismatch repair endonuclease MutL [Thermotogota bacterium]HPH09899.1 DNA mismatch repair endonuclease MutL [Thermotogota bacterium]